MVLEVSALSRQFGARWALAGVNMRLSRGHSLLVAGPNGAGKTTLLRLLAGILQPTSGMVRVVGADSASHAYAVRKHVTLLAQRNGLYLDLTARENLQVFSRLRAATDGRRHHKQFVLELLERVGLQDRGDDVVRTFSAGMCKRLAFAKVLMDDARLVLLDEPYGHLDSHGLAFVDRFVRELCENGRTLVLVTHLFDRARVLTDSAMVLNQGRMTWVGPAKDLPPQLPGVA